MWPALGATLALLLRLIIFDWQILFVTIFPNHDLAQGAGFAVPNLSSLRLFGDLAWWKANSFNGYAHYYQTFLSPLAPTPSHVSFMLLAIAMWVLDAVHVGVSEYVLYLILTYVIVPWAAFAAFGWLTCLIAPNPFAVLFSCVVYGLSTVGLWGSAWFYFQELFTLNLVIASFVYLLQNPSAGRVYLFFVAVLIQVSSINYWTFYNLFFVAAALLTCTVLFSGKLKQACVCAWKTPTWAKAVTFASCGVWLFLLGSIAYEQSGRYVRPTAGAPQFSEDQARKRIQYFPPERALPALLVRETASDAPNANPMHRARYVGVVTIIVAVLALLAARGKAAVVLAILGGFVGWMAFAPEPMVWLWARTPLMSSVQHVFYFYPHFLAQILILLGALGVWKFSRGRFGLAVGFSVLGLSVVDLSFYYREVTALDRRYTERVIWPLMQPLTLEKRNLLTSPLNRPRSVQGFEGGIADALPIRVAVFPNNYFYVREPVYQMMKDKVASAAVFGGAQLMFLSDEQTTSELQFTASRWTYNEFTFSITAPANGSLLIRQAHDPAWVVLMDGMRIDVQPALDGLGMIVPVEAGRHKIAMDYRPMARRIYFAASLQLLLSIGVLLTMAAKQRPQREK